MVRFAPPEVFDEESPAAEPLGEAPVALPRRRSRRLAAPSIMPTNPLLQQAFPSWARPPKEPAVGADAGFEAAFCAGAGLALLDAVLSADPPFAGALRQRLALRAIARILPRCATPSIFRPAQEEGLIPVWLAACIGCGAVSPRAQWGSTNKTCAGRPICSNCRGTLICKRSPGRCNILC